MNSSDAIHSARQEAVTLAQGIECKREGSTQEEDELCVRFVFPHFAEPECADVSIIAGPHFIIKVI